MTTTPLPTVQSNQFHYALPAQRLPEGAYELSDDGTVWRSPGPPLPYNSSGWANGASFTPTTAVKRACFSGTQAV